MHYSAYEKPLKISVHRTFNFPTCSTVISATEQMGNICKGSS